MNVKKLLENTDDEIFKDKLVDFLSDQSDWVDLDEMCNKGGYAEIEAISVNDISRDDGTITCDVLVEFSETIPTSCANVELNDSKSCTVRLRIESDGEVEIDDTTEHWDGGDYSE